MNKPEFPENFMHKKCPKVQEARYWRIFYDVKNLTKDDDLDHAECALIPCTEGFNKLLKCENCGYKLMSGKHVPSGRGSAIFVLDEDYKEVSEFYENMAIYEARMEKEEKEKQNILLNLGNGI